MSQVIAFRPREPESVRYPSPEPEPRQEPVLGEWGGCPWSEILTEYDKRNIGLFARLLHDESEGASEADIARNVFSISFWLNSQRARLIVRSHLKRAHWLEDNVFPMLGW